MKSTPTRQFKRCLALAMTAAALVMGSAQAQTIHVNYNGGGDAPDEATLSGPAGGLGTTWNSVSGPGATGALNDSGNNLTTVSVTTDYAETTFGAPTPDTLPVFRSFTNIFARPNENTVTISGLAGGEKYDIWLLSFRDIAGGGTERSVGAFETTNTTSSPSSQAVDSEAGAPNGSAFLEGYNYVLFNNVEATVGGVISFTAKGEGAGSAQDVNSRRLHLNGLQLRPSDLPAGPVDADVSTVEASPASVAADGASTSTITVTLRDAIGKTVEGKEVTLANTAGEQAAVIAPVGAQTTDENGEVIFTVSSSTVGMEEFTATDITDANLVITQTASVEFTEVVVIGPVDASVSTVEASPSRVAADGSSSSTITVTLKDADENPVAGKEVTLANTAGPGVPAIDPVGAQATDANGEASFTVSSITIGAEVFTATDVTDANLVITQTASVDFLDPDAPLAIHVSISGPGKAPEAESSLVGPAGGMNSAWNQFENSSTSTLKTSTGTPTTIEYTTNYGIGTNEEPLPGLTMLIGGVAQFAKGVDDGANGTLTITGLDAGLYDIWLTSYREKGTGEYFKGDWTTTNTTSTVGAQPIDNMGQGAGNGDTWVSGVNFVLFEDVEVDGSGTAVFNSTAADAHRHGLNGFQLQESDSPDPFVITAIDYSPGDEQVTLSWIAEAGAVYTIFYARNPDDLQAGETGDGDLGDGYSDNDLGGVDLDPAEGKITVEVTNVDTDAEDLFFSVHKN